MERPSFEEKEPRALGNIVYLISELSSVRTRSVMTARACTTVCNISQSIIIQRNCPWMILVQVAQFLLQEMERLRF